MIYNKKILVIDDEIAILRTVKLCLGSEGFKNVSTLSNSGELIDILKKDSPDLIILDLTMPSLAGEDCLQIIQDEYPEILVIVLTGVIEINKAIECMKLGARDYLMKPVSDDSLCMTVTKVLKDDELETEAQNLKRFILTNELRFPEVFSHIITVSPIMKSIFAYCEAVSHTTMPILLSGETGTGKELMVEALHKLRSPECPLVSLNVAGLDDQMFSDTLFGHVKGAYTGAQKSRSGLIENASGGILFLDEIGDLKMESQIKLLRLIQEGEYYPVGADRPKKSNVWIIAATHVDLENNSNFRKDLYFRLKFHKIDLPPLRKRVEDIVPLIKHFFNKAVQTVGLKKSPKIPTELFKLSKMYDYPGNVRELKGIIFDLVGCSFHSKRIPIDRICYHFKIEPPTIDAKQKPSNSIEFNNENLPTIKEVERELVNSAMERSANNKSLAAKMLGITRQTLAKKLQE